MFQRILVANRGEIALRVIRACKELGVEVAAVYSEADRDAPYLDLADAAVCIGPALASESYLNINRIIAAAEITGSEAIHPGYGFLSENARFAEVCRAANIEFIGPPAQAMTRLGNKDQARKLAREANVPVVPGSGGLIEKADDALAIARQMGFPVLVKAAAGGGGKGMRVARDEASLITGLSQASQEAEKAFKDGSVYLEKYIEQPRHIEVQILGDLHGNLVHLWERECSLQRRHQKLVEESPAPNLPPEVRAKICESAVRLVKTAGYSSAGTCEFLVDKDFNFYFIEVNARIQVEHPVTEMVTGIDLIKTQLQIAAGEPLPFKQSDITQTGVALECRINAEDPERGFQPSPGRIERMMMPGGPGVRFDTHAYPGYVVSPHYDSMIGKLLVHRPTRAEAIVAMQKALGELRIEGIKTTAGRQQDILRHAAFAEGTVDTKFIERTWPG